MPHLRPLSLALALAAAVAPAWGDATCQAQATAADRLGEAHIACGSFRFVPLGSVHFDGNGAKLDAAAEGALQTAAAYAHDHPDVRRIILRSHTDHTGTAKANHALSLKRAASAGDYLVAQGVAKELLHVEDLAATLPTDEPWTIVGRQRNRRVEIYAVEARMQTP